MRLPTLDVLLDDKERYLYFLPDMFELEEAEASTIKDGIFLITIPKVVE